MKTESKYRLRVIKNGKPFYGEVILEIESNSDFREHQIIEKYQGQGFRSQGYVENISPKGYGSWKKGIRRGINYALKMLTDEKNLRVTTLECNGLMTDTNPIILAFVASRAILNKMENKESEAELKNLEEIVFSSWNYELDSQMNFENLSVDKN